MMLHVSMLTTNVRMGEGLQYVLELIVLADDLGVWRASWNKLGKPYLNRYFKHFPIAPPEEDHDDRNLLYAT
jgi:hypothetical protein